MAALRRRLPECRIRGAQAGLHLLLELPAGTDASAVVAEARRRDLQLCDLDEMRFRPADRERSAMLTGSPDA